MFVVLCCYCGGWVCLLLVCLGVLLLRVFCLVWFTVGWFCVFGFVVAFFVVLIVLSLPFNFYLFVVNSWCVVFGWLVVAV